MPIVYADARMDNLITNEHNIEGKKKRAEKKGKKRREKKSRRRLNLIKA
jgi:hypothetical protein